MHRAVDDSLPHLRAVSGLATTPPHEVQSQTVPVAHGAAGQRQGRPGGACVTHLSPRPGWSWRRADDGYRTCTDCYNTLHRWLTPRGTDADGRPDNIPHLYLVLDARPGSGGPGRRAPGFASRSPANDHVLALGDSRTVQVTDTDPCSAEAVLRQWVMWVWDERYDDEALDGKDYRKRRRELPTTVHSAAVWLDNQLDWLTRHEIISDFHLELRELRRQLRNATGGKGQPPVGHCIEILTTGECRAPIYMPRGEQPRALDEPIVTLPELVCPVCESRYTGRRLILLRLAGEKTVKVPAGVGLSTG